MSAAVKITRGGNAGELRRLARLSGTPGRVAARLLAVANVLDGMNRTEAARLAGMTRQTLRDWVHRYNEHGVEGVRDAARSGRPPALSPELHEALITRVTTGPDPARDGVVRWRRVDLQDWLATKHSISLAETSIGRLLRKSGFRRLSARPQHPETDVEAQETLKKTLPQKSEPSSPTTRQTSRLNCGSKMKRALAKKER